MGPLNGLAAWHDPMSSPIPSWCGRCPSSRPAKPAYAFAYTVTIRNTGDVTAQLIARHWIIVDAEGPPAKVRGLGGGGPPAAAQAGRASSTQLDAHRHAARHGCTAPSSA